MKQTEKKANWNCHRMKIYRIIISTWNRFFCLFVFLKHLGNWQATAKYIHKLSRISKYISFIYLFSKINRIECLFVYYNKPFHVWVKSWATIHKCVIVDKVDTVRILHVKHRDVDLSALTASLTQSLTHAHTQTCLYTHIGRGQEIFHSVSPCRENKK